MTNLIKYSRLWFFMLIVTLTLGYIMGEFFRVKSCYIINVQFSDSFSQFKSIIISTLGPNGVEIEDWRKLLRLDFAYIISYTALFYFSLKVFDLTLNLKLTGRLLILICIIPGLFDVLENVINLYLLNHLNQLNNPSFNWFYWFVRLKWFTVIPFLIASFTILLYYLTVFLRYVYNKFQKS